MKGGECVEQKEKEKRKQANTHGQHTTCYRYSKPDHRTDSFHKIYHHEMIKAEYGGAIPHAPEHYITFCAQRQREMIEILLGISIACSVINVICTIINLKRK